MQAEKTNEKFFTAPLIIIFVTVFVDLVGFGMVIPILPYYANTAPYNATPFQVGVLLAVYSLMQFFFSPVLGRLSDRYGRRPILLISILGSAVGYFVIGLANTLLLVFIGRIIGGITGANISTAQAYIADITSIENRAKGMGLFGAAFGFGFVFGPAMSGILSKFGPHVPFFVAAGLSFLNAAALYFILPESLNVTARSNMPERKNRFFALFEVFSQKEFREINIVYFLLVTSFSIMTYGFVLYTKFRFNYSPEQNGYLFAFIGIMAIIAQGVLFNKLVAKFGESALVAVGCLLMMVSLFAVPIVGPGYGGLTVLLIGTALLALGNSLASPGLTSLASKTASEQDQGRTLGMMQSGASLARVIGPLLGGILLNNKFDLIDDSTLYRTFWTASAIMFVAFLVAIYFAKTTRIKALT